MNKIKALLFAVLFAPQLSAFAQAPVEKYPVDSASVIHAGVPKGELVQLKFNDSKIYPGTTRNVTIYVPAQYDGKKPACLYVNQDGVQFKAPTVFDNLINNKEIPVTIAVFIAPGQVAASDRQTSINRNNRSYEYDSIGDTYIKFLLNELLPEVEKQKTADGRPILLSKNANDRAIGGSSSGAIAAFNAAWERPDQFTRIFSSIGTYVGFRGAERFPTLIRKYEPKPLRIFMQDGTNDLNNYVGDWWITAQMMERAFQFAGYEVDHAWGEGGHNGVQATAIFPQAMRFLWKDYPKPVAVGVSKNAFTNTVILPGQGWELVGEGYGFAEGTAVNAAGEVFYQDIPNSKTYKVDVNGKLTTLKLDAKKASGTAFGPDGKRYTVAGGTKQILSYDADNKETVIASDIAGNDLTVANNGNVYVTVPDGTDKPSKIYLIKPNGEKTIVDEGIKYANGLTLSPDQTELYVTESSTHWVYAFQVKADGTLSAKQRFGWLHVPDTAENAWSDGAKCDINNRIYVATRLGIQILDEIGRVISIMPTPNGSPSNLCFGGPNFDILYVSVKDKVYRRKVGVKGANSFDKPFKPNTPKI
ncbi:SMP-30/gluconolactonase/LRE family protein [Mucilaginibacter sp.]|uniref:SMP-30/gluconolactonase/LRE family protein n=1 Tax=Mucilaginibacter sp. TaxID=1882438 RepID=UPI00262A068F|nr:SMP-30/gluconolactonase/LRE family protein [Mucilaginibacter sp.]MDB4927232.1 SMP-30/Gluconolaconase/LRE-like region-containing protein [Mucilaginibacter sp.]